NVREEGQDELAAPQPARLAIEVGLTGAAGALRERPGNEVPGVEGVIATPGNGDCPAGFRAADGARRAAGGPAAPRGRPAPAHVDDVDVVRRVGIGVEVDDVIEGAERERLRRVPLVIKHLDGDQLGLRRDADDAYAIQWRSGSP